MALSNSQPFTRSSKENSSLDVTSITPRSYANAVKGKTKQASLLHQDLTQSTSEVPENSSGKVIQSRIYRSSRTPGALLFDVSACYPYYTQQQIMKIVKNQHPKCHSCIPLKDGTRKYLELYIDKEDDDNDIVKSGLTFEKLKLQVIPCVAIRDVSQVINVKLSHLPLLKKDSVLNGLKVSLAPFGSILDIGIFVDKETEFFMGNGYAVLDICPKENGKPFAALTHNVNWNESKDDCFHATWNNMPTWCRYCHKEGHTKFECPESKAKIVCYSCHQHGHRSFECPRKPLSVTSFKKARKGRREVNRLDVDPDYVPSAEVMKSKYAPKISSSNAKSSPDNLSDDEDDIEDNDYKPSDETDDSSDDMSTVASGDGDVTMVEVDDLTKDQQADTQNTTIVEANVQKKQGKKPKTMAQAYFEICGPKNGASTQSTNNMDTTNDQLESRRITEDEFGDSQY